MASFYESLSPTQSPLDIDLLPTDAVMPGLKGALATLVLRCFSAQRQQIESSDSTVPSQTVDRITFAEMAMELTALSLAYKKAQRAASRTNKEVATKTAASVGVPARD